MPSFATKAKVGGMYYYSYRGTRYTQYYMPEKVGEIECHGLRKRGLLQRLQKAKDRRGA